MKNRFPAGLSTSLLLGLLLITAPLQAVSDNDFYIELMTGDESRQSQDAAFAEGMRAILVRLSGDDGFWLRSGFSALVANAPRYIRKFNYRPIPGDSRRKTIRLWYRPGKLRSALQARGFAFPGDNPPTLLWLLEQQGGESWLMAPDEPGSDYRDLPELARAGGVTLMLPLVDLQERTAFNGTLPTDEANASLVSLSQRYDPGAVLVGRLSARGGGWRLDWTRIQGGNERTWDDYGPDIRPLLEQGVARLAAVSGTARQVVSGKPLELAVGGLRGSRDLSRVSRYLEGLSMIDRVRDKGSRDGWSLLQVGLLGDRAGLKRAIAFGGLLRPIAAPQPKKKKRKPEIYDPLADFGGSGHSGSYRKKKPKKPAGPPSVLYVELIR